MKKTLSLLLTVSFMLCTLLPVYAVADGVPEVTRVCPTLPEGLDAAFFGSGNEEVLPVTVDLTPSEDLKGLSGYELTLSWNASVLELETVAFSDLFPEGALCGINDTRKNEGILTVVLANVHAVELNAAATLLHASFRPISSGHAVIAVTVGSLSSEHGSVSSFEGGRAEFEIEDAVPPVGFIPGDVSLNGTLDGIDYLLIRRYTLGSVSFSRKQCYIADCNGDGSVDMLDYLAVKRAYFGIDD